MFYFVFVVGVVAVLFLLFLWILRFVFISYSNFIHKYIFSLPTIFLTLCSYGILTPCHPLNAASPLCIRNWIKKCVLHLLIMISSGKILFKFNIWNQKSSLADLLASWLLSWRWRHDVRLGFVGLALELASCSHFSTQLR